MLQPGLMELSEAEKPRAGTIRRKIFDEALVVGETVNSANKKAKEIGQASARIDADILIGLFKGHIRLP